VNPEAEEVALLSYGALESASIDEMSGNIGWWGVPPAVEENGYYEYTLSSAPAGAGKPAEVVGSSIYAITRVSAGTGDFNHLRTIYQTVNQVIDTWITNLPANQQESARKKVQALPWTVMWTSGGNAYKHVTSLFSPKVILYFNTKAQLMSIAHETGHYMCHALLGYTRYNEMYNRFPTDFWGSAVQHDLGSYRAGRKEILEDYPYISMLLVIGDVDNYDLTSIAKYNNVRDMCDAADPALKDYPSHEAFGAAMLASLRRTSDTVYTFSNVKGWETARVPVVGAPWSAVLGILAKGPRDPNELRTMISDYLSGRGTEDAFKLPAMMEPLGWSYNGKGRVLDDKGKPVAGAHVQPISQDGSSEYRLPVSTAADSSGYFFLPRLFPGSNILRVFFNADKDSLDFPYTVEWDKPTNEQIDLGKFTLPAEQKTIALEYSNNYVLTPGIRAQNPLTVSYSGSWEGPRSAIVNPQKTTSYLDVQMMAPLYQDIDISVQVNHTLRNGLKWTTSLSQGDYGDAASAETVFSQPRLHLFEYFGPSNAKTESFQSPPSLRLSLPGAPATNVYYRADVRLEWDYTQTYYDKAGKTVGSKTGNAGVIILHVYRDVWSTLKLTAGR
jgi:hypothetical protein